MQKKLINCSGCGFQLSPQDAYYYTNKCEDCTRYDHEHLQKWRKGADDIELDILYGNF